MKGQRYIAIAAVQRMPARRAEYKIAVISMIAAPISGAATGVVNPALKISISKAADIAAWEQVQVVNLENGSRILTYVIPGEKGSGVVALKGPAARTAMVGDRVIVISYIHATTDDYWGRKPLTVIVDENNHVVEIK